VADRPLPAHELADIAVRGFEARGIIPEVVIPDSDDEIAKAALREACVLAWGRMACNMVLKYAN
jgi:hypothetical protein